jgi:hypothetical protein
MLDHFGIDTYRKDSIVNVELAGRKGVYISFPFSTSARANADMGDSHFLLLAVRACSAVIAVSLLLC